MRIIHLMVPDDPDIKPVLRRLAESTDPIAACRGRMLLDLVGLLEARGPAPSAFSSLVRDELWFTPANRHNRARVGVRVDWRDRGPIRDGLPAMHYRLSIRQGGARLSRDERTTEPSRVDDLIRAAFGWTSPPIGDPG